jgi:hypothetical protein
LQAYLISVCISLRVVRVNWCVQAKLKGYIHDPNAPELVHFLFTPLMLVIEASRDSVHGTVQIPEKVIAPLLTADAFDLLHGCMVSKERDLLKSLGDAWNVSK